jgi:beta-barrel assembly-enhancing protease
MACSFRIRTLLICAGLAACNLSPFLVGAQSKRTTSDADIDKIGHRKITIDPNFYSPEQEIKLGKQLAQEVERSSRMVGDPVVVAYLNELGQKIAQNSDSHFPISFGVIDTNEIDALTLLGGHQYINRGLILQAETEGELAAVLAYGIASTVLRGATRNATKAEMMQLATIPLTLSSPGGWGGTGIYQAANLSIPITYLKLERDLAFDADYFGIQYLYKSGYDPESMPRFFERVWPLSPAGIKPVPLAFSPYPPLQDRLKAMRTEIQKILPPRDNATVSTSEFEAVKEHLRTWNPPSPNDPGSGKPTLRKRASAASQSSQ